MVGEDPGIGRGAVADTPGFDVGLPADEMLLGVGGVWQAVCGCGWVGGHAGFSSARGTG